jgi:hypothetical protein
LRRIRLALASAGVAALTVAGALFAAPAPNATASDTAAAAPTASQLLAKAQSGCVPASNGKYATDEGGPATISICKNGSAYVWTSDLDIDCDGVSTSHCNSSTDPAYFNDTSFQTSAGRPFTADLTHFYVIPLPSSRFDYHSAGITPGSVAAVIYNNRLVYAVFADEGPDSIIGEASYATAQALGIDPDPATGGTEGPATFIVFPGKVPNPVENNATIDTVGAAAAGTWVGNGGTTTPPGGGGTGQITGLAGKCVDVAGASSDNGTAVDLYTCNGTNAQQWTVGSDNTLRALGKCLDVTDAATTNGAKAQLYDCNGSAAQKWTQSGKTLVNTGSGRCLDATGPSSADGTRLQIWDCFGGTNQQWTLPA